MARSTGTEYGEVRRRPRGRWRGRVRELDGPAEMPGALLGCVGILVLGGVTLILVEEIFLPVARGYGETLSGEVADGLGLFTIGLGALVHFAVFWRSFPTLRRFGTGGVAAGGLTMVAGLVYAFI